MSKYRNFIVRLLGRYVEGKVTLDEMARELRDTRGRAAVLGNSEEFEKALAEYSLMVHKASAAHPIVYFRDSAIYTLEAYGSEIR